MKAYFERLFEYDLYANLRLINAIITSGKDSPKAVGLIAHLLAAQQIWLARCKGEPAIGGALWPDWPLNDLANVAQQNNENWISFINTLQPENFERQVAYKNSKGDEFANSLVDVMAHLINHGTHHRAQAGQQLKVAGIEQLPNTDYIFYIRER